MGNTQMVVIHGTSLIMSAAEGPSLFLDLLSSCHVFSSRYNHVVCDGISWILTYIGDSRKDLHHRHSQLTIEITMVFYKISNLTAAVRHNACHSVSFTIVTSGNVNKYWRLVIARFFTCGRVV